MPIKLSLCMSKLLEPLRIDALVTNNVMNVALHFAGHLTLTSSFNQHNT